VFFGDYECPPCRHEWSIIEQQHLSNESELGVYFRQFPLPDIHPHALEASIAAKLAQRKGEMLFPRIHRALFEVALSHSAIQKQLTNLGLGGSKSDYFAAEHALESERSEGSALGVQGTPTMFLIDEDGRVFRVGSLAEVGL
jgi:protein-disulfide isomerase